MNKYNELLKNKNFLYYFTGRIISSFGDNVNFIAIMLYVFALTGKALDVSLYMLCTALPKFIVIPCAGILADRFNKKRILIIADIARCILVVLIPLCANVQQIFILSIFISSFTSLSFPTRQAFYPTLVEKKELMSANSLNSILMSVITLVGFAAGGAIVGFLSAQIAFIIDSATFIISAILLCFIRTAADVKKNKGMSFKLIIENMRVGIRYCWANNILKFAMIFIFSISMMVSMVDPMIVTYTKQSLHASEVSALKSSMIGADNTKKELIQEKLDDIAKSSDVEFSIIFIMVGLGGMFGAYINGKFAQNVNRLKALILMTILDGLCLAGIGSFPYFYISAFMFIVWGVVATLFQVYLFTLIQEATEQENMGKVFGIVGLIRDPAAILSYMIGGVLVDLSSPSLVITVVGFVEISICILLLLSVFFRRANNDIEIALNEQRVKSIAGGEEV